MSYENPASFLIDIKGAELAVSQSQVLTGSGEQPGFLMAGSGSDGVVRFFKVAPTGEMYVTGAFGTTATPNTPVSQGLPGGILDSWNVKITDGANVLGVQAAPLWTTGSVSINNFPVTQQVTGSVTVNGLRGDVATPVWVTGSVYATQEGNPTATVAPVVSSISSVTLLAANSERRGAIIFNDSTKRLYVKLGTAASSTSYTVKMSSQGYWEVPGHYTGIITGIWESVNGNALVTEILD